MKREDLKKLIAKYSKLDSPEPARSKSVPRRSTTRPTPKVSRPTPRVSGSGYPSVQDIFHKQNEQLASVRPQRSQPRLNTSDMVWVTIPLRLKTRTGGQPGQLFEYKGLRIGSEPFIAIRAGGPQSTSNLYEIYNIDDGSNVWRTRGTHADIYRALKHASRNRDEQIELRRQNEIRQSQEAEKAEQRLKIDYATNHGKGFYILPYYSVPELRGTDEPLDDLYGEPEGDCLGPFHRDVEELSVDLWSNAEDEVGALSLEDLEDLYWSLFRKLPATHKPFKLVEAKSRKDALAGHGHTWIINGVEKGPPVDPRQIGFWS